jgi:TRAP-type C4-dicarboxylate transport system substrate-binding protein
VRLLHLLASALLLLDPEAAAAQAAAWNMSTEYPQSAMPGVGITTFAARLAEASAGKLQIKPGFDTSGGIRSADMIAAIVQGRVQAGDAFASTLSDVDPIFALASLPFLVGSIADARRLSDLARPFFAAALLKKGQRLLYLTPWPPSGIWSKTPLKTSADLANLSIRTYDTISSEVFASAGAKAISISFADTMPKLADGSINAVLSSGDGGAGRELWKFLPFFSEITYSLPLSVAIVSQAIYDGLSPELREAVDTASRQTENELWLAMRARQQDNYRRMRDNGVTIESGLAPDVIAQLQSGAAAAQQAWCAKSGLACHEVLEAFKAGKP